MKVNADQLVANLALLVFIAFVIETVVASVFSIKAIEELLRSSWALSIRNAFVFLIAFGLCAKVPQLRLFYGSGLSLPAILDYVLTSLFLARMANVVQDFFAYIKRRSREG